MGKLIVEGRFIYTDNDFYGQAEINTETGLIENVSAVRGNANLIAAKGCLVFPGFSDLHMHARQDASGQHIHKEDFTAASEAAINGGVVHIADMPNNPIAPVNDEIYEAKESLTADSLVPVTLYAGIGPKTRPLKRHVPYKLFMGAHSKGSSTPYIAELDFFTRWQIEEAVCKYRGKDISIHCENPDILVRSEKAATHEERRPAEAEDSAVDFVLSLIGKYDINGNICHLSTKNALKKIKEAKSRGIKVTCEAAPHHLFFDRPMLTEYNRKWLQMNPPLRDREDRLEMIESLRAGDIDYLVTDHAPHTREEKARGISGVPQLDTYGCFVTWLMKDHAFTPQDIARVCSYNPGNFLRPFLGEVYGKGLGKIEDGYAGSLTIIDPNSPVIVSRENLKTKCGWSPFEGIEFPGRVAYTIVRGKVYKN